jgi:uncharacterized protein YjgD (DUF1641 family)
MQLTLSAFCLFISTMSNAARTLQNMVSESLCDDYIISRHVMLTVLINLNFADELMSKLYNSIASKRENVIAIYTARHPSFVSILYLPVFIKNE